MIVRRWKESAILAAVCLCLGATAATPEGPRSPSEIGPVAPPAEAPAPEAIQKALRRGVDFLLGRQNKDGSWGSSHYKGGEMLYDPVPGAHHAFRVAVTSLCVSALLESGDRREEVSAAIDRGEAWMFAHLPSLRRATADTIYNNWGHAYAIAALADMYDRRPQDEPRRAKIKELVAQQVRMLARYECVDGGWAYYDTNAGTQRPSGSSVSFVTATALVSLAEAKRIGVDPPEKLIRRAMDSIRRQRKPDFSYCYDEEFKYAPMHEINRPGGSLGRSQACNLAMHLWHDEKTTPAVIQTWLERLFARNLWLDLGRKRPIPHESWFSVAGYFFYYGHYYAARSIELLEPSERGAIQDQLAQVLLRLQEKDGSWWDYPLYDYHQQYGTAFAIMSLAQCRHGARERQGATRTQVARAARGQGIGPRGL